MGIASVTIKQSEWEIESLFLNSGFTTYCDDRNYMPLGPRKGFLPFLWSETSAFWTSSSHQNLSEISSRVIERELVKYGSMLRMKTIILALNMKKPILTFSDVFTCKIEGGALLIFKYLETKAISFLWKLSVIKIGIKCLMIVLLNKESGYRL